MRQLIAIAGVVGLVAVLVAGLLGWVILVWLAFMVVLGLVAIANELARSITRRLTDGTASGSARGAAGER